MNSIFSCFMPFVVACMLVTSTAHAMQDSIDPNAPDFNPAEHGLVDTPIVNEHFGLTMYYPVGSTYTPTKIGESWLLHIIDAAEPPQWQVRIQRMSVRAGPEVSPRAMTDQLKQDFVRRSGQDVEVLVDNARQLGSHPAHEIWMRVEDNIAGFVIAQNGPATYMAFRVTTSVDQYERVRSMLRPAFATIRLNSADELKQERASEFARAQAFIEQLSEDRLRSVLGLEKWYRIYQADASGNIMQDREMGYFRVRVTEDQRGALNPGRDARNFASGEREAGLMVAVDARYLERPASQGSPAVFADIQVRMWEAWDRSEEAWVTRVTHRQGEASRTESESGTRSPPSLGYSKLKVVKNTLESQTHDLLEWVVPDIYLSQPEVYLLGSLLPRDGSIVGKMRFHAYETTNNNLNELPVRVDEWRPAQDGSGNWILESRPVPDLPGVVGTFDRNGRLIRREKPGNIITEPMDRQRLLRLWQQKGLPTTGS